MAALHVVSDEIAITTWYAGDWLLIVTRDIQMVILKQAETDGKWINKAQNRQEYRAFKTKSAARRRYNTLIREFGAIKILTIDWATIAQNLTDGHGVVVRRDGFSLNITTMSDEGAIVSDVTLSIGRSENLAETWMVNWLWSSEDPYVVFTKDSVSLSTGFYASLYLGTALQNMGFARTPIEALEQAFDGVYA